MERSAGNAFPGHQEPPYYHNHHHQHHQYGGYHHHHYGQSDGDNHHFNHHHQHHHQDHQYYYHHQQNHHEPYSGQQNMTIDGAFYGGGFGRKRSFQSYTGASPDSIDVSRLAKLYVAPVPRTATEEDIRSVFGEYGNVLEIIVPRDKRTGERGGYCFVKYKTLGESDRAIAALQDQYTFLGEVAPIKVRYADGERDRLVQIPDKLYVGCLNKQTTKMEIQEVFSVYGIVEDIYIVRDELRQSRGCAFVQFSRREMALAAIKALNGVFIMRGCDQPLIVKFADPKRPRSGDMRSAPNVPFPMQQAAPNSHPPAVSQWVTQDSAAPMIMQQQGASSESTHCPQQQSCQQAASEVQKLMHQDISPQSLEQQQNLETSKLQAGSDPPKISSNSTTAPQDPLTSTLECDWSEHICPDGYKYYYNCATCESTWERPEEYSLFEKQLLEQKELQESAKLQSPSPNCSSQEAAQAREMQSHTYLLKQKLQAQQSSPPTLEPENIQVQPEISVTVDATCA